MLLLAISLILFQPPFLIHLLLFLFHFKAEILPLLLKYYYELTCFRNCWQKYFLWLDLLFQWLLLFIQVAEAKLPFELNRSNNLDLKFRNWVPLTLKFRSIILITRKLADSLFRVFAFNFIIWRCCLKVKF